MLNLVNHVGDTGHAAQHDEISHRLLDMFWVSAVGDGVADDSPAFQSAIDAAAVYAGTTRSATVYIPRPKVKYRLATGLVIQPAVGQTKTPHISILGAGARASQLWGDPGVTVLTIVTGEEGLNSCTYEKFGIYSGARGIHITQNAFDWGLTRCAFRHLHIAGLSGDGFYADGFEILECTFEHIAIERCDYGGYFVNSGAFNLNRFVNCQFRECVTRGLYVGNVVGALTFDNCLWESNQRSSLELADTHYNITFLNCWFEGNGSDVNAGPYPIILLSSSQGHQSFGTVRLVDTLIDLTLGNNGQYVLRVISEGVSGYLIIDGCRIYHPIGGKLDLGSFVSAPILSIVNLPTPLFLEGNTIFPQPSMVGVPVYADNAAALAVGLKPGAIYRTGDLLKVVH